MTKRTHQLRLIMTVVIGIVIHVGCNSGHSHDHHSHAESGIVLNSGHKWQVNPEMKPHIEKAQRMLEDYENSGEGSYRQLAEDLQTQNEALIQSCTMKGDSHDQLHKWLHPHIQLVEELAAANNPEEAEEIVARIEDSFHLYHHFFE